MAAQRNEESRGPWPNPLGQVLTTEQVAEILHISQRTVQRAIRAGHLKAYRVGRIYRVLDRDLQAWWATLRTTPDAC